MTNADGSQKNTASSSQNTQLSLPAYGLIVLVVANVVGLAQYLQRNSPNPETLLHLRLARDYLNEGWLSQAPWLPSSSAAGTFFNPHLLTQWLLVPFLTLFDDPLVASSVAVVFLSIGIVLTMSFVLAKLGARSPKLWAMLILGSSSVVFSGFLLYKSTLAFSIVWLWSVLLISEQKYKPLFILSWITVYLCSSYPLLLLVALAHMAAVAIVERKVEWRPPACVLAGTLAGLVINPFWPHQWSFLGTSSADVFSTVSPSLFGIASDLPHLSTYEFLSASFLPLLLIGATIGLQFLRDKRLSTTAMFLWLITATLYCLSLVSFSFFDFLILALLMAVAVTISEMGVSCESIGAKVAVTIVAFASIGNATAGLVQLRDSNEGLAHQEDLASYLEQTVGPEECVTVSANDYPYQLYLTKDVCLQPEAPIASAYLVVPKSEKQTTVQSPRLEEDMVALHQTASFVVYKRKPKPKPIQAELPQRDELKKQLDEAIRLLDTKQYSDSKLAFEKAHSDAAHKERYGEMLLAAVGLSESLIQLGNPKRAIEFIDETELWVTKKYSRPPINFLKLGALKASALVAIGNTSGAIALLREIIAGCTFSHPKDHTLRWFFTNKLVSVLELTGDIEEAKRTMEQFISIFENATTVKPKDIETWNNRLHQLKSASKKQR